MTKKSIQLIPIGIIHSPILEKESSPIQSSRSDLEATVEVLPQYEEGLLGIEEFSHIYLFYVFHRMNPDIELLVEPFLDNQVHGIFATRYPVRPNPLGFSVVRLLERHGNILRVRGADMLDKTPLMDIKPYIPEFDIFEVDKIGWYQNRKYR
jgi:tRNA (adenine37-N6)-methyltransferase